MPKYWKPLTRKKSENFRKSLFLKNPGQCRKMTLIKPLPNRCVMVVRSGPDQSMGAADWRGQLATGSGRRIRGPLGGQPWHMDTLFRGGRGGEGIIIKKFDARMIMHNGHNS